MAEGIGAANITSSWEAKWV